MAKGTVVIASDRCKGCELCTSVCPQHILHLSTSFNTKGYHPVELSASGGQCTGCGLCALICPDVVFTVYRYKTKQSLRSLA